MICIYNTESILLTELADDTLQLIPFNFCLLLSYRGLWLNVINLVTYRCVAVLIFTDEGLSLQYSWISKLVSPYIHRNNSFSHKQCEMYVWQALFYEFPSLCNVFLYCLHLVNRNNENLWKYPVGTATVYLAVLKIMHSWFFHGSYFPLDILCEIFWDSKTQYQEIYFYISCY